MSQGITDAELIAASRRGERAAFGELVARYQDVVCAVSYSSTRNHALSEDVAQDTFLAAWAQLDQLRETSRVRAWLCGIARNLARKARTRREQPDSDVADGAIDPRATPFDATSQAETERLVASALGRIPAAYREVLVLYYRHQRSIAEVADALGLREDAAMQRLTRGRRLLAGELTAMIDDTLARHAPRRDLVPRVLAALPPVVPAGTIAAGAGAASGARGAASSSTSTNPWLPPSPSGASMFKIAIAITAGLGAVGAGYVATRGADAASTPAVATSPAPTRPAPTTSPAAAPTAPAPTARAASAPAAMAPRLEVTPTIAGGGCAECATNVVDDDRPVDAATIAATHLYEGPARGPANAPVQIAVFTDLECSFCASVLGTIDQLWDEYPNQLRLVVKQLPVHGDAARLAAEATLAAEAQGKFWPFHDLALAYQDDLTRASLIALAGRAGLDVAAFTRALDAHTFAASVDRDVSAARTLGIEGTPAFVINGRRFTGARPITEFRAAIDRALGK